ncbi:hypothetical protein TRFO_28348 [Tritrichomonas foetus]|uniref:RING-type domain-containing protein n=1 Tax=Tritrichomonas foetus TaxID=1144522 RepID=A0A1J4JZW7_9EUKA|nr:hypothetical protein TRFO_28348 [Tritrichomonas foetus]|eukprot:OHT04234.1 hypothetical protein TRFO_28348 [Tritrichomonas foetus]
MGGSESSPVSTEQKNETPKIRSQSSYYGQNTDIGEIDSNNLEETIRDLQLEKLYIRNPNLRPKAQPETPEIRLKTVLSVSDPPPFIKRFNDIHVISFGLKSEAPGIITLIANNLFSSLEFPATDRRSISIPLPVFTNFIIDITPNLDALPKPISKSYTPILKHVLEFKVLEQDDGSSKVTFVEQVLHGAKDNYRVTVNKNVPIFEEQLTGNCLLCSINPADRSVGSCGHNVACGNCIDSLHVRLHHCPVCGAH